ncbi:MAG: hypothetical protein E7494_11655 [Ruminococcus albus]|jgi:hypothetical protein|uniref:Uncharacterized protein n=1 Tax=Ruminococcus albus SY3 TaxID=1341156 RepID=A0A011VYC6_RUMAL|nr:hypothetical protein [Ruminococcus albus]EXM40321.1 hypothetical protein RASY3_10020 [Ruminococcus albus SY3]MBE6869389.1 hypothetical protein [Ruminococcus albus]
MAKLKKDVKINDDAFDTAIEALKNLWHSADDLRGEFEQLFKDFAEALQCETGEELTVAGQDVILEPIDNLKIVIQQVYNTLQIVINKPLTTCDGQKINVTDDGDGYYKRIFDDFNTLVEGITT